MNPKRKQEKTSHGEGAKLASICLFFLPGFFIFAACTPKSQASNTSKPPLAVRAIHAKKGPIKETIRYVGTVHSRNEIKVLARVTGKVAALPVDEGKRAKRGVALALIAAPEMDARVNRLYAEVLRAKQESDFLCQQAETDRNLLSSHAISKIKSDASRQKCKSSRAALDAAEAGLHELKVMALKTVERAPFAGKVLSWLAEPGENVMPGRPILIFGDDPLELRVHVHEKDVRAGIGKGSVAILMPEGMKPFRARVDFLAPMALGVGRMMEVKIPLGDDIASRMFHGMSVDVAFVLKEKSDAVSVPVGAVLRTKAENGVFVVQENVAHWKTVRPLIREKGWIAVDGDVDEGDLVVVGNLEALKDSLPVYPVSMERKAP